MGVVSEPEKEVAQGNAKYIKECTELYLVNKGIEKLRGFEPFVNLESLWLNGNKLKKINNLDRNFRIRALYAHDNQICTLRGSLSKFRFLETLDLSNNQLRDLDKQLKALQQFKFLRQLNLTGNPCVEEPDYRLAMVHALPQLHVLDQHVVTDAERRKAAMAIGGNVQALTVAFMQRVPIYNPAWDEKVPERSVLEQGINKEAAYIKDARAADAFDAEIQLFRHNPHPDIPLGRTLPPNAGTLRAQQVARELEQQETGRRIRGALTNKSNASMRPPPLSLGWRGETPGYHDNDASPHDNYSTRPPSMYAKSVRSVKSAFSVVSSQGFNNTMGTDGGRRRRGEPDPGGAYVAKDMFRMTSCTPGVSELQSSGTRTTSVFNTAPIRFEQEKYQDFVKLRTHGREKWGLEVREVKL